MNWFAFIFMSMLAWNGGGVAAANNVLPPLLIQDGELRNAWKPHEVIQLRGFNHFGFDVSTAQAPDQLWLPSDLSTLWYRMHTLGMNAVRLPFKFGVINTGITKQYVVRIHVES